MKMYTIINETTLERIDGYCASAQPIVAEVEEVLYTQWELTPCTNRCSWAYPFLRGEKVRFSFHGTNTVLVWQDATGTIRVKDI
jgi:hypothetical protein